MAEVLCVPPAEDVDVASRLEPRAGVLANGLQQMETLDLALVGGHERLVDKRGEQFEHIEYVEVVVCGDRRHGLDREAAAEDRQLPEQLLFCLVEQAVGPFDGRLERSLTRHGSAGATRQETKALVEKAGDSFRGEGAQAGCSQLERERNAIETPADLCEGLLVALGSEAGFCLPGSFNEEPNGIALLPDPRFPWKAHGTQPERRLAWDAEQLSARCQHSALWGHGEYGGRSIR